MNSMPNIQAIFEDRMKQYNYGNSKLYQFKSLLKLLFIFLNYYF